MAHLHAVPGTAGLVIDEPAPSRAANSSLQPAVLEAISAMHARYFDAITLEALAAEVFVSPFHFSRIFAKATGVTPGRYLTAVRLFEAKRLLLTTSLTVSDVVCSVGYSSVGTFTTRFTKAVGMTPTQYREPEVGEMLVALSPSYQRLPPARLVCAASRYAESSRSSRGVIHGRVEFPAGAGPANVLVGVFADTVPQSGPVAFTGLMNTMSANIEIRGVPDGNWVLIALAEHPFAAPSARFSIATVRRPVAIRSGRPVYVPLMMRPPLPIDAPIAITLASRRAPLGGRVGVLRAAGMRIDDLPSAA